MIPGRLGLLVTLSLCIMNTLNSVAVSTPKSDSSTTALIKWIMICLANIELQMVVYSWILLSEYRGRKIKSEKTGMEFKGRIHPLDKLMMVLSPMGFCVTATIFWASVCYMS